jgi:hypothetical protein
MERTDILIDRLSDGLSPVARLRPPFARALLWLAAVSVVSAALVSRYADLEVFISRAADPHVALELVGTLGTGVLAVVAAFMVSVPDRSARWALVPLPAFALWIGNSGYACWRNWISAGPGGWTVGESAECFLWILTFGLTLGAALMLALRRARPLSPLLPAVVGGLGVAALAAFLLQFFHPFDVTVMDLALHLAGVGLIVLLSAKSRGLVFTD